MCLSLSPGLFCLAAHHLILINRLARIKSLYNTAQKLNSYMVKQIITRALIQYF